MKPRVILTAAVLLLAYYLQAQDWIGNIWALDTSIALNPELQDLDFTHIKSKVCQGEFYYVESNSFQKSGKAFCASIHSLSLYNYNQTTVTLPLPEELRKTSIVQGFWINDLDFRDGQAAISVQDKILLYHKNRDGSWSYDTLIEHPNIKIVYLHNGSLFYLEEQHDTGYLWFQRSNLIGEEEFIRLLSYDAPHVVQASPNRYLFHDTHYVYFLSNRFAILSKYSLDGNWIEDIDFQLPHWHPFETSYIEKALSVPYGIERIHATMADIFSYSYPKMVFPIGSDYLMYYTQYDTLTGKSRLQYVILDNEKRLHYYLSKDNNQNVYDCNRFPFNLLNIMEDKARTTWNDCLIELTAESNVDWRALTPSAYEQAKESFFRHNDPIYKIRIIRYKNNNDNTKTPFFIDEDHHFHALNDLPSGKHIFLVNNALECSGCKNNLLKLLQTINTKDIQIGILHSFVPGALQEREMHKSAQEYLKQSYQFYFLNTGRYQSYPHRLIGAETTFPALLFHETGKAPILFSTDQIFEDDVTTYRYRDSFQNFLETFSKQQTH